MIRAANYRLLDFGNGRKLEQFGDYVLDRPSPAADGVRPMHSELWPTAHARFGAKRWSIANPFAEGWSLDCVNFKLPLASKPFGHVGAFPEQSTNWNWLFERGESLRSVSSKNLRALNLFAYTGGSTLALAAAGVEVAHVDAARPNVMTAREAALLSGLHHKPIRYLVDDAVAFVAREVRRKRQYEVFVLDPPAYGHGPSGKSWRLERDLFRLLQQLDLLVHREVETSWLISGHSASVRPADVQDWFQSQPRIRILDFDQGKMDLTTSDGRTLNAGWYCRVIAKSR